MPGNFRFRRQGRRGISLIIVLASIVLLTLLILAFLSSVSTQLKSSKVYANGSSVKLLVQSTVSLVIGQIQTATSDQTKCWASQPGMIRTYDNTGTSAGETNYKLYSDSNMQTTGAFTAGGTLVPTNWYSQKGVYIDLNQPVNVGSTSYYPILDGNSSDYSTAYTSPLATLGTPAATSVIKTLKYSTSANLGSNGLPGVTGFWLTSATPTDPTSPNVAPMPVMWLYVLQNGAVITPDSTSNNSVVTFKNATQAPTSSNPIVGRLAYWTDDETCKVNVNTASEGTTWATPRVVSQVDYGYATSQPQQNEFQRYPGHPSTVSMSTVFNGLTTDPNFPEDFYPITPRVIAGGSKEGTVPVLNLTGLNPLTLRSTRLYATADEFLFQPSLASGVPGVGLRSLNDTLVSTTTILDQVALQKAKFFITANSEAPDVNVFNLPRVSMWPITLTSSGTQTMTAYDQLIAYCGTVNGSIYYFQRQDPTSATTDLPPPASASSTGLGRNRELLEYLRTLTSQNIPGFGGSFSGKYGTPGDRDQILAEMFDYIRATNLQDSSTGATVYAKALDTNTSNDPYAQGGLGQVVPIIDQSVTINDTVPTATHTGTTTNNPRGFGRLPTVQEAALVFIGAGDSTITGPTGTVTAAKYQFPPSSYTPLVTAGKQRVQCGFFLQMFDPSEGLAVTRPWYRVMVSGLGNLQWNGVSIFPAGASFPYCYNTNGVYVQPLACNVSGQTFVAVGAPQPTTFASYNYGGLIDYRQLSFLGDSATGGSATANGNWKSPIYPFISPPTGMPANSPLTGMPASGTAADMSGTSTIAFTSAGDVTVQIYALSGSSTISSTPIQTVYLNFPSGNIPVPITVDGTTAASNLPASPSSPLTVSNANFVSFLDTYTSAGSGGVLGSGLGRLGWPATMSWFGSNDVIRAIVASPGDMRTIAARQYVPDSFYKPLTTANVPGLPTLADYSNSSSTASHMLRYQTGTPVYGAAGGKLIYYTSTGSYSLGQTQYFTNSGGSYGTTYSFAGSTGYRPKDVNVPNVNASILMSNGTTPGDWDTGFGNSVDGAYINKADEGDGGTISGGAYANNGNPYYELDYGTGLVGPTFFSPNRMIPSPVMFGSLPSQVFANQPWQTLQFRPGPAGHFGLGTPVTAPSTTSGVPPSAPYTTPPDHLFLDLFNMPVVEPYAISSPLATSGRINMNYQIVPFTYINRDTGLRAAMKNQMVTAIPTSGITRYKLYQNVAGGYSGNALNGLTSSIRYTINLDSTLSQFLQRFYSTSDIFHSASEICDIDLVPNDATAATSTYLTTLPITRSNMDKYWTANSLTGDNLRELPYADLYPLLTTKSNTFTVHYRVQTLKQLTGQNADPTQWREGTDVIVGESRGSQTIERYVDPSATVPDYATSINSTTFPPATPLNSFYKFRVISSHQFAP